MAVDYSKKSYWRERLSREKDVGFEWLLPTAEILSTISDVVGEVNYASTPVTILHFGCGSSTLGVDLQRHLGDHFAISDADYASSSLHARDFADSTVSESFSSLQVPLYDIDVLDLKSLLSIAPTEGWDVFIDKSTADAISCSPPLPGVSYSKHACNADEIDALSVLCANLRSVASRHCRWISISYSATRFDFLTDCPEASWHVVTKIPARLQATTSTKEGRVVHQPATGTWIWVLAPR
ncbi:hypothetical protein CC85DRAFT_166945 [Cutaneotrichosporon oleaginosum]|uniref:Methyltransferase domain-containing protein n=1 Tax=Cutaneotrichosporon oleaginosum TaxID=879819 RepID=A0A0J1AXF7_9TREE|nr:uncharacterized protein CC85DRAFT_166945 [Cutaneotrichosporon oleaginosum]KLT39999.1 hypothetical protein CC85DRAFT_166945 [Cutaneotrichosporon oleaginosum]TXT14189.1 hypothetical protein COLE_00382 [Cutaneotrichosporon oleaginosum]